jgi:hypothetical protein
MDCFILPAWTSPSVRATANRSGSGSPQPTLSEELPRAYSFINLGLRGPELDTSHPHSQSRNANR